jgi:DNA-binding MarR family transcriptional regulator
MNNQMSLKSAERKTFQTTFSDGLWDVLLGCYFLEFVIAPYLSEYMGDFWSSAVFLPFWGLVYFAIWLIRKHVVAPRIGVVRFGEARKRKLRRFSWVMLTMNIILFILGIVAAVVFMKNPSARFGGFFGSVTTFLGLSLLLGLSAAAYILDFPRLYIYAVLLFIAPLIGEWLYANHGASHHGLPIVFGVIAGIMTMGGTQSPNEIHPLASIDPIIHASARLMILTFLYVVESADYVFLMRQTGLTWGNLATHLNKLEDAGYISVEKTFKGKKPQTILRMTEEGRNAFRVYKKSMQQVLDDLPD